MDYFPLALSVFLSGYVILCLKRGNFKSRGGGIFIDKNKNPSLFWLFIGMYGFGAIFFLVISIVGQKELGILISDVIGLKN